MLQAFHNDQAIKNKYVARVIAHREADNIIRGTGWDNGKGCAALDAAENNSDMGGCSCHINPPCGYCMSKGEDDDNE